MAKLPKSIIKKYGITKKAWQVFRSGSGSSKTKTKVRGASMARRRVRRIGRRSSRSSGTFGANSTLMKLLGAGAYGAFRSKIATAIDPITSKIPLGSISDEAGMLAFNLLGDKFLAKKVPILKGFFTAGMYVEGARIGEALADGSAFASNKVTTSSNVSIYDY